MSKKVIDTFVHPVILSVRCSPLYVECVADAPMYNSPVLKFNEYHTGQKLFPLDEEVPLSKTGERMQDLHHRLFGCYAVDIVVEVLEDGTLRVKKDQSNLYSEES